MQSRAVAQPRKFQWGVTFFELFYLWLGGGALHGDNCSPCYEWESKVLPPLSLELQLFL